MKTSWIETTELNGNLKFLFSVLTLKKLYEVSDFVDSLIAEKSGAMKEMEEYDASCYADDNHAL